MCFCVHTYFFTLNWPAYVAAFIYKLLYFIKYKDQLEDAHVAILGLLTSSLI